MPRNNIYRPKEAFDTDTNINKVEILLWFVKRSITCCTNIACLEVSYHQVVNFSKVIQKNRSIYL